MFGGEKLNAQGIDTDGLPVDPIAVKIAQNIQTTRNCFNPIKNNKTFENFLYFL